MDVSMILENQLVATKFFVPVASGALISRPRLTVLLDQSLKYPLTLVSAPAGFGKTTLLSAWSQSLSVSHPLVAWVSLDEEDNDPRLFWTYILAALEMHHSERFSPLLKHLQSPQAPPLKYILTALINLLMEGTEHFLLILDDYHVITGPRVHTTLSYLVEHLPPHLHIILATRADPLLPLSQLRARRQVLEVRTDQLRCTPEETQAFFKVVMGIQLPDEMIQEVTARTEGWLVGLQLLGLSLPERADPLTLLEEASGDQRYILDYLTEQVLRRQPQEAQTFLLSTSILEQLTGSLCDAVMEQHGSQKMLQRLEQANLFLASLDSKRQWYRYHALFAQALYSRLKQTQNNLVPILHHRASLWYAQHGQTTEAILHALRAHEWQLAADLLERISLLSFTWGAGEHKLILLRQWLEQLPADVVHSRPRLCLATAQLLWAVSSHSRLEVWLDVAETALTASLITQTHEDTSSAVLAQKVQQEQENLLGEVIATRAYLQSYYKEDGQAVLLLCQQALALLSAENFMVRILVAWAQLRTSYASSANDALAAVESGLQACSLVQATGQTTLAIAAMGMTASYMIESGRLHEAQQLAQQAIQLGTQPGGLLLPEVGWPTVLQADILRQWNQIDAARALVIEGLSLCKQTVSLPTLNFLLYGYAVLLRVSLSCREFDTARSACQEFEHIGMRMNQPTYRYHHSFFTTIDQIRFWLACGELERATRWAEELDIVERHSIPFAREREEVACIRVLLARGQPALSLDRLKPVLQRATTGQRWGHVLEMQLLQALAHQMLNEETQALSTLSKAVGLAEPEGYIQSFVDEGAPMEALLSKLQEEQREAGPTPYLDTILAAFPRPSEALRKPLSERELEVLQLLAHGASNQEIAQELVIGVETVKSHVSQILSKLGVKNRFQAARQAQTLGLLGGEV